ncbi:MAG: LPS assembly lipoprotein LptE [Planctomycetota bacterium]
MRFGLLPLLLGMLAGVAAGCQGYSTQPLTTLTGARTIGVLPIVNKGYRRDLEMRLTHALLAELRARGTMGIVEPTRADVVLSGEMSAAEDVIGQDDERRPLEKRLRGTLDIVLRERATGRVLRRATVDEIEEYRPDADGRALEGPATDAWTRRMARRAVDALEAPL